MCLLSACQKKNIVHPISSSFEIQVETKIGSIVFKRNEQVKLCWVLEDSIADKKEECSFYKYEKNDKVVKVYVENTFRWKFEKYGLNSYIPLTPR